MNGKRQGKGREYDELNNLIFEGEYLNGKRNGKGEGVVQMEIYYLKENI